MKNKAILLAALLTFGGRTFGLPQTETGVEQSAKAILERNCLVCHGESQQTSGLDLRQTATILKGGKRGPAVIPGKAEKSLLYQAVSHTGELKMPPGKERLPQSELDTLREWINQEAGWKKEVTSRFHFTEAQKSYWAFQAIKDPKPPPIKASDWAKSTIDRFILAKLEANELSPAPQADKRTLIRR